MRIELVEADAVGQQSSVDGLQTVAIAVKHLQAYIVIASLLGEKANVNISGRSTNGFGNDLLVGKTYYFEVL